MAPIRNDLLSNERPATVWEQEELRRLQGETGSGQQEDDKPHYVMDHKTFEKEIPDFLSDRLDNAHLSRFLDHFDECPICRDELYIQYLVKAGLPKLETGETFNLQKEVDGYIATERSHLFRRRRLQFYAYFLEVITLLASAAAVVAAVMFL